jgi:hypothetical protein
MTMQNRRTRLIAGIALIVFGVAGLVIVGGSARWADRENVWGRSMIRPPLSGNPGIRGPMMQGPGTRGWTQPPITGARVIEIEATDTALTPAEITVRAGEAVNITLVNRGSRVFHLAIPAQGVWLAAAPGQSVTTGFKADAAGEYQIFGGARGRRGPQVTGRITVAP